MLLDYLKLGIANIGQRRLRSWLTMIGIFIGVALVVALLSLGQGMQDAIVGQFSSLGADTLTVQAAGGGFGPPGSYQSVSIGEDDLKVIKRTPGVESGFGRLIESVRTEVNDQIDFGYLVSLPNDPKDLALATTIPTKLEMETGRMLKSSDTSKVILGNSLSTKDVLGKKLLVGDRVSINGKNFDVVGVLEKTGNPQLDIVMWATEDAVKDVTGVGDKYGLIVAKIESGEDVNVVKERVEKALRKERDVELGKEDFIVESSQEVIDSLNSVIGAVKWFLVGIAFISLLVGSVGITNTMYTAVMERTREIGIMKAIGATNANVLTLFLIESGFIGMMGGLIGIALGAGLALGVAALAQASLGSTLIQAHLSFALLFSALAGSFLVGSVAGLTPAMQAAKMKPVEALQYG